MTSLCTQQEIDLAWEFRTRWYIKTPFHRSRTVLCRLAEAQNWRCCYCGCRMTLKTTFDDYQHTDASFEHVIPSSRGGTDDGSNLVVACRRCNSERGNEMWTVHYRAIGRIA